MKNADAGLIAFLQQRIDLDADELPFCELFTLTLTTGDVLLYTDFDADVTLPGAPGAYGGVWVTGANAAYLGAGLVIPKRGNIKSAVGCDVDEMQLDFLLGTDDNGDWPNVLRGMSMQEMAANGWLDKAQVAVHRLFWQTVGVTPPWRPVWKFSGEISKPTEISRQLVSLDVMSWMQRLQRQVPNSILSPCCPYQVYDARCGVAASTYGVACTAGSGSTAVLLQAAQLTQPDETFDNGYVLFTSGANKGLAASVKYYAESNGLQLDAPLLAPVATGDAFTAYPGCDYTQATCTSRFDNASRFGGWPWIPAPETAI